MIVFRNHPLFELTFLTIPCRSGPDATRAVNVDMDTNHTIIEQWLRTNRQLGGVIGALENYEKVRDPSGLGLS